MSYGGSTMFSTPTTVPRSGLVRGVIIVVGQRGTPRGCWPKRLRPRWIGGGLLAGSRPKGSRQLRMGGLDHDRERLGLAGARPHDVACAIWACLAERIITEYPDGTTGLFRRDGIRLRRRARSANRFNRNPLLGMGIGADGLKTGHTSRRATGLWAPLTQGSRRVTS